MYEKYKLFLRWWLLTVVVVVTHFISFNLGLFHEIWTHDITKLSFVILAIYFSTSIWCGWQTWQICELNTNENGHIPKSHSDFTTLRKIKELSLFGWFLSDMFLTLGMIGTIIGFIFMFSGSFASLDLQNAKLAQAIMGKIALGMATALYTTLVGLVYSTLLKLQYFNLDLGIKKTKATNES